MNPVAIIQARLGSSRLPNKVLAEIEGTPVIAHVVERVRAAGVDVVVATTRADRDVLIRALDGACQVWAPEAIEADVLSRYYQVAESKQADPILRVTGDCPLIDPDVLRQLLEQYSDGKADYVSVATGTPSYRFQGHRYPDGLDAEVFSLAVLRCAWANAIDPYEREHVMPFVWRRSRMPSPVGTAGYFRIAHLHPADADHGQLRVTLDTEEDLARIRQIYAACYKGRPFSWREALGVLTT